MAWDGNAAKGRLIDYAKDKDGNIVKSKIDQYFGIVEGKGDIADNYKFPMGDVTSGKPHFDLEGLKAAFTAASGSHGAPVRTALQSKIIAIIRREFGKDALTEGMQHDSSMILYDAALTPTGDPIFEDENIIDVPIIAMREGVWQGTDGKFRFKNFDKFKKDAHWLNGQPITMGHPKPWEEVVPESRRLGQLMDIKPREDKRDISAIGRFYKNKLTPDELEFIKSGKPFDGSIGYRVNIIQQDGEFDGKKYTEFEDGNYVFYHYAIVPRGACTHNDGCGFYLDECYNSIEVNHMADEEPKKVTDSDGKECLEAEMKDGKCPEVPKEEPKADAAKENPKEPITEETPKTDAAKEPPKEEPKADEAVKELQVKLDAALKLNGELTKKVDELTKQFDEKQKQDAAFDEADMKKFGESLSPNTRMDVDVAAVYSEMRKAPGRWLGTNRGMLLNAAGKEKPAGKEHPPDAVDHSKEVSRTLKQVLHSVGRK